jgi:Spy/CpxP family protein refolding chaperone
MNRFRLLSIGSMLIVALTAFAQQTATGSGGTDKEEHGQRGTHDGSMPTAEEQLKVLTEKLNLTGDQQAQIKPILRELHDATQKLVLDKRLSREERLAKVRPQREKADKRIRAVLNEDEKRKLDQYEQGPHSEMHGNLSGTTPPVSRSPQF